MLTAMPIDGCTRVVGVFGDPVEHTLSPPMQNRAFVAMGLPYVYVPWHVLAQRLADAVSAIRALGLAGVNVTIPHKVAVMGLLDELTPEARLIGAVNTIENRDGWLVGHNTDGPGFLRSLTGEAGVSPQDRRVLLLGAGGAARAIAVQMLLAGVHSLVLANRTLERARQLQQLLGGVAPQTLVEVVPLDTSSSAFLWELSTADILVNTTSAGMYPHHTEPALLSAALLRSELLVCDIVYSPRRTSLLVEAERAGCTVLPGLGMLAHQGAMAIEIWTGRKAPVQLMKETLDEELARRELKSDASEGRCDVRD
ncbi:MAG: shikimate dehydrogenase [Limnochordia bacterium]